MLDGLLITFMVGGAICLLGQLAMDLTPFFVSSAHVLVSVILLGELLSFFGLYQPLIDFASMGASVPLSGFGHTLVQGVFDSIKAKGFMGLLTGSFSAGAAGLTAAVFFGYLMALIFKPKG